MENNNDLAQSLTEIKNVAGNASWFRDTPHRWAESSLPLAYAMACVEVVSKMSDKAGAIYRQIIEAWGKPGLKVLREALISEVPDSEIEKVKSALLHPENELIPDPNKPFRELEAIITDDNLSGEISIGDSKEAEDVKNLHDLIVEFIIIGFNRESDIAKGKFSVTPEGNSHWLILAITLCTYLECQKITLEKLRKVQKVRTHKGKIIDFHKELTDKPTSRWHRRMVASSKAVKLKLKNDRMFVDAARAWYQCRIKCGSVSKYCDAQWEKGITLDPKNIEKKIRPCDDALGYIRRMPRKTNK